MRYLVTLLLSPYNWYLIIFLSVTLLYLLKKQKEALQVFITGFVILIITSLAFIPDTLIKSLETRYPILNTQTLDQNENYYILVMGAGFSDLPGLPHTQRLPDQATARLIEGIRIQNELPGSIIVVAGGTGKATMKRSEVMANAAYELGADSLLQLGEAKNTLAEVKVSMETIPPDAKLIIATSALHMPRTMYHVKLAELEAIPAPTNFILKKGTTKYPLEWLPSTSNINNLKDSLKEYLGLLVAHLERSQLKSE